MPKSVWIQEQKTNVYYIQLTKREINNMKKFLLPILFLFVLILAACNSEQIQKRE